MGEQPMNEATRHLRDWCIDQREAMLKSVEMMRAGNSGTRHRRGGGPMEDTTEATIADHERRIAELDELLAKIKADHSSPGQ